MKRASGGRVDSRGWACPRALVPGASASVALINFPCSEAQAVYTFVFPAAEQVGATSWLSRPHPCFAQEDVSGTGLDLLLNLKFVRRALGKARCWLSATRSPHLPGLGSSNLVLGVVDESGVRGPFTPSRPVCPSLAPRHATAAWLKCEARCFFCSGTS